MHFSFFDRDLVWRCIILYSIYSKFEVFDYIYIKVYCLSRIYYDIVHVSCAHFCTKQPDLCEFLDYTEELTNAQNVQILIFFPQ